MGSLGETTDLAFPSSLLPVRLSVSLSCRCCQADGGMKGPPPSLLFVASAGLAGSDRIIPPLQYRAKKRKPPWAKKERKKEEMTAKSGLWNAASDRDRASETAFPSPPSPPPSFRRITLLRQPSFRHRSNATLPFPFPFPSFPCLFVSQKAELG